MALENQGGGLGRVTQAESDTAAAATKSVFLPDHMERMLPDPAAPINRARTCSDVANAVRLLFPRDFRRIPALRRFRLEAFADLGFDGGAVVHRRIGVQRMLPGDLGL